jgi:hypothetical protein
VERTQSSECFSRFKQGVLAENFKRSCRNTRGHREDVEKNKEIVKGDGRSTISEIAGRISILVCNIVGNCKEEFEHVTDPAKFVLLFLTGEQKRSVSVC